jgi:hypothetical protein
MRSPLTTRTVPSPTARGGLTRKEATLDWEAALDLGPVREVTLDREPVREVTLDRGPVREVRLRQCASLRRAGHARRHRRGCHRTRHTLCHVPVRSVALSLDKAVRNLTDSQIVRPTRRRELPPSQASLSLRRRELPPSQASLSLRRRELPPSQASLSLRRRSTRHRELPPRQPPSSSIRRRHQSARLRRPNRSSRSSSRSCKLHR